MKTKQCTYKQWIVVTVMLLSFIVLYEGIRSVVNNNIVEKISYNGVYQGSDELHILYLHIGYNKATITAVSKRHDTYISQLTQYKVKRVSSKQIVLINSNQDMILTSSNNKLIDDKGGVYIKVDQ